MMVTAVCFSSATCAQPLNNKGKFTRQDTLRGTITTERGWWNVLHYNLHVAPDYKSKTLKGWNEIMFTVSGYSRNRKMQIDLQQPMNIDSVVFENKRLAFKRLGNVFYIEFAMRFSNPPRLLPGETTASKKYSVRIYYSGKPREAINPPWDGGWIWKKDTKGNPWMTVACQGLGASVWYPCKDHQGDEPDNGAILAITVPDSLVAVGNGRLISTMQKGNGLTEYQWEVKNPINNYNIVPYIGKYAHFSDSYIGETEKNLTLDYWVLAYNEEKAKKQFDRDVKRMLKAFEYWFGPYPFYEDGFKLVESSHLGMEHQSATAYGNHYLDGYLGGDLSGSGWGMKWDYIIIHESGHEWFGNNITTADIADMWVHEGFTMYSEVLFVEYFYGKQAADEYLAGIRNNIDNDIPLIGPYGVNQEGSGDMYNKGASLLHTIRQVIDDDSLFRKILRGLNNDFYHKTVTSKEVEKYFSSKSGKDLSKVFDQYLRTIKIPVLEYRVKGDRLEYRWTNSVAGFNMPVRLAGSNDWLRPTNEWKSTIMTNSIKTNGLQTDDNFYITVKKLP